MALIKPTTHKSNLEINEGEMLVMLDTGKNEWFLAEITQKYQHKVVVNYFSTPAQSLDGHDKTTMSEQKERLSQAHFRKTWFVHSGKNAGRGTLWLGWAHISKKVYGPWHQGVCFNLPMIFCA